MFKNIKGYEGLYQVSDKGQVLSLEKKRGHRIYPRKILTIITDETGYSKVSLFKNGKTKRCLIHRLVAQAFLKNNNNYPQVNHKDGNKANNTIENLEYCTASENMKHAVKMGLNKGRNKVIHRQHLTTDEIRDII